MTGKGNDKGLPLRGGGCGGGRRTGSSVWVGGSRTAPTGIVGWMGMMGGGCGGWIPAPARKTEVGGTSSCGWALMVQSRRYSLTGKGNDKGLPLWGMDVVVVVERVR